MQRDSLRGAHDALRKQRLDEFMAGFSVNPFNPDPETLLLFFVALEPRVE